MRFQSPEYIAVAMFLSAIGLGANPAQAASEVEPAVAYVEEVSGPVVAFSQGKPTLLDALDVINDRTRLDLPARVPQPDSVTTERASFSR